MGAQLSKHFKCFKKPRAIAYEEEGSSSKSSLELEPCIVVTDVPKSEAIKKRQRRCRIGKLVPKSWCTCCRNQDVAMTKAERTIKATILIQMWYRRYMARLEVRRRYTWTIFQTLEYAGEQDQVKLYNFFNALLAHIPDPTYRDSSSTSASQSSSLENLGALEDESPDPDQEFLDPTERKLLQFKVEFPITENDLTKLIDIFRKKRHFRLPPSCVAEILQRAISALKRLPNLNEASTALSKQITVCGDLHGKFDDLLVIFHKNGLPSQENPYVFNGDFVDRGKRGLEVLLVLLCCFLVYPRGVYLNRGNHEDCVMNQRYGFIREVQSKYRRNAEKLLKLIEGVYRYLPLGTIVNNKVLIVHGGISDTTDLDMIKSLDRGKYVSLLRPPLAESDVPGGDVIDKVEWKQVFDILWSDPQPTDGCIPNNLRGAGTYFGPDVTKKFLESNKMKFIIRSHECKPDGYEVMHDKSVITIFSASNYYEVGSNNGAYLKLVGPNLDTHYVQYMANSGKRKLTFFQRMSLVESGAIKELHGQIAGNKAALEEQFALADPENTGLISVSAWCRAMEAATGLQIPWRMLKDKLVSIDADSGKAKYITTFDIKDKKINSVQGGTTVVETLYRNKKSLEAIFHILDKDKSGFITLDEFSEALNIINQHMPCPLTQEQLFEICALMDINKDGKVDLNEFLETFRMVDPESQQKNQPASPEPDLKEAEKANKLTVAESGTPPISPALVKPLLVMPQIDEEKNGQTIKESDNSCNSTVTVEINEVPTLQQEEEPKSANGNISQPKHINTLKMSPVLSNRKGV